MPGYDAFISYSHAADAQLAPALQRALQRFAKPWWKLRALNLFRDETSLAAASSLTGVLLKALDTSRYFILLASPRAAASKWCNEEVAHWLKHRSPDTLLIVLTEGTLAESLPAALKDTLREEPYWLDLSWARQSEQVSERDPRFQQVVAKLAATLHGRSLEDISGDDVRQHRLTRRVATGATVAIAALAIGAGVAAWEATRARDEAERQRGVAEANAAEAERQRAAAQKSEVEAKAQRDAAERALAQTLEAADTLVIEIADGMKDFAGVPRARVRRVLERAEKILDALPAESDSPAILRRRVQMSLAFADAQIVLGDTAQALRRSSAAVEIARRQSEQKPHDANWRRDLAAGLNRVGDVQRAMGDLAAALGAYEEQKAILERLAADEPGNDGWQRNLSAALDKIGNIQRARGDLASALRTYQASLAISERLAGRDANNVLWQRDLAVSLAKVADVLRDQGDLPAARNAYETALAIRERMAKRDAGNTSWQRDLATSHHNLGNVRVSQGDLAGALDSFEASRVILERLARSDPGNAGWQRDLASAVNNIGVIQDGRGDRPGALRAYQEVLRIRERLAASDPGNAHWQRELALSLNNVADMQRELGDLAAALRSYEAARTIRDRLVRSDPANALRQRELSVTLEKMADVQLRRGDLAAALQSAEACLKIRERLAKSNAGNAGWQFDVFRSYWQLAHILERMPGRLAEAGEAWRRAVDITTGLVASNRLAAGNVRHAEEAKRQLAAVKARLAKGEQ